MAVTRFEQIMLADRTAASALAHAMADASAVARTPTGTGTVTGTGHQLAIRDVAAGVAAPALVGYVLWVLQQASQRDLRRLCFVSRDAQVFYEIAQRLAPWLGSTVQLRYVHGSRRTWNLGAADPANLASQDWLFNSFMRSNAGDVCARLGLSVADFAPALHAAGASLDPQVRADQPGQAAALRRFVASTAVSDAVTPAVNRMRTLVRDYTIQEKMASADTGLVDAGWTGRMIGALTAVTAGLPQPRVFFWAHEPRVTGWTDPARVRAYMYNTATRDGVELRVPDTPYIIETFCMSDHGIVADYHRQLDGQIVAVTETPSNPAVEAWGLDAFRSTVYRFCDALTRTSPPTGDPIALRPVISQLLRVFWISPTLAEAAAWGAYPYDSDPLARATRPLARPFDHEILKAVLAGEPIIIDDRAWLQGSLALSGPDGAAVMNLLAPQFAVMGAPATD